MNSAGDYSYYDSELYMYYLGSRYYYPAIGRFLSADRSDVVSATPMGLTDKNLFAYCDNNPIMRADKDGEFWLTAVAIGAGVGAITGVAGQFISDLLTSSLNGEWSFSNWQTYAGAALGGAAYGAVLAATGSVGLANATSGFVTTGAGLSIEKATGASDKSWVEIGANAIVDGAISYSLGGIPMFKGRNNISAVYRAGLTKLRNDTVSRMSAKVVAKGLASTFIGGLAMDVYYGIKQFAYDPIKQNLKSYVEVN